MLHYINNQLTNNTTNAHIHTTTIVQSTDSNTIIKLTHPPPTLKKDKLNYKINIRLHHIIIYI